MAHVTGNNTWVDWPNTSPIISAAALASIEDQLDRNPTDSGFFLRRMATSQSIVAATNTTLVFGTSVNSTTHVTSTSTSVFTCNVSGIYILEAGCAVGSAGATSVSLWIFNVADNTRYGQNGGSASNASGFPNCQVSFPLSVVAGTQFSAGVYSSAAATIAAGGATHFSVTLLRQF